MEKKMKKIIYSVLLIFSVFVFLGCGFGKNPLDDTEWNCYRYSVTDGMSVTSRSTDETWRFDKSGDFSIEKDDSMPITGSWNYDEPILSIETNSPYYNGTYSVVFDGDSLELTYDSDGYSIIYYLTRVEDDSSILDGLPF